MSGAASSPQRNQAHLIEIEAKGIVKRFPNVLALNHVSLEVRRGEIHALMGENGAGKTTLMSTLYGLTRPDLGQVLIRGNEVVLHSPAHAMSYGIGMVHQSFKLFDSLTVWENVVYGAEPARGPLIDRSEAIKKVRSLAERFGLSVDPLSTVGRLPVGVRQRVEILKALYRDARILILDEPTAVLTPGECDTFFSIVRRFASDGRTVLLVTHKMREVMAVSSRITVLRDGQVTALLATENTTPEEITRAMTGRNLTVLAMHQAPPAEGLALEVEGLTIHEAAKNSVSGLSLFVRHGEIVGIAGVAGNGQTELIEAIAGLRGATSGKVKICSVDVSEFPLRARRHAGMGYVPEDRQATGSAAAASATDNCSLGFQRQPPLSRRGILHHTTMMRLARDLIARFEIKIRSENEPVRILSGGNLQKLVVAREFNHEASIVLVEQPTRGVDVAASDIIHRAILDQRDRGRGVLLVSSELAELTKLSDRILVMFGGEIIAEIPRDQFDETRLGLLMAGQPHEPKDGSR
ncbi:ABC transporter ATP-binding protein [Mesorhizobium koreense]|uniref:ABC transporter ATP-binding protein n=1 Tax=Mesorhizobium koreense TaxID=3074855 RepID=UPI00287B822C|nr:ABC transporter ATP-binding protein [Mesorhizobium sp. WR6]